MLMLKRSWEKIQSEEIKTIDKINEKTIQNCFLKAGISTQPQECATNENNDPFKEGLCNDDDPIGG